MGIQLLNGFGGMQTYYKASQIPSVSPQEVKQQEINQKAQQPIQPEQTKAEAAGAGQEMQQVADKSPKVADLENISLTFNKEESFDYIGSESGLADLDMQKAISDMRKDQILEQYQQFVGSAQNILVETEDGIVIPKSSN